MATYQEYAQRFARDISDPPGANLGGMLSGLQALIDALPYYGNHEFQTAHRGALSNLLEAHLPNKPISPQSGEAGFGWHAFYYYNGPHAGYRDAFYGGVSLSPSASNLAAVVLTVKGGERGLVNLDDEFWGKYGVAVLTDAVRQTVGGDVDAGKLTADLANYNRSFLPALAASYYAVYGNGFSPTANALNALKTSGQIAQANAELCDRTAAGQFTANINLAIAMGGDSAAAAVWFLFNLWVTLKALGNQDVDGAIRRFQQLGLNVPPQVGPGVWWSGGYTSWWSQLSGSDVVEAARGTIQAGLPERREETHTAQGGASGGAVYPASVSNPTVDRGYCWSLTNWGGLNWYKPQPPSCFGRGTRVLMADGSVKAIEQVEIGDEVRSADGPKRVVLVVSPLRAGRPLYGLNRLDVYFTAGHPLRTPGEAGAAALTAVDPWTLIDSVATMTEQGVATLGPGSRLSARGPNGVGEVSVAQLDKYDAAAESDERVYDLVLERSETGMACYYVGGPDSFLAVDTEWPDPLYEHATTHAIVTAIELALPACRASLRDSVTQLPDLCNRVQLGAALPEARTVALSAPEETKAHSEFDPDSYLHEGEWDPHASALGNHLVRRFARAVRREIDTGWRVSSTQRRPDDRLTVVVHDVQLLGDVPIGPDAKLTVGLRLRGWDSSEDAVRKLDLNVGERPVWHIALDGVVEFGRLPQTPGSAYLLGDVTLDDEKVGEFLAPITEQALDGGTAEYFLFGGDGEVVGRIALEPRRSSEQALRQEREQREAWASHHKKALAAHLGSEIVRQMAVSRN